MSQCEDPNFLCLGQLFALTITTLFYHYYLFIQLTLFIWGSPAPPSLLPPVQPMLSHSLNPLEAISQPEGLERADWIEAAASLWGGRGGITIARPSDARHPWKALPSAWAVYHHGVIRDMLGRSALFPLWFRSCDHTGCIKKSTLCQHFYTICKRHRI